MASAEVGMIMEILNLLEAKVFVYVAVGDDRTCPECMGFDGEFFTENEAETVFPFLEKDSTVWFPNVHPNCRCRLVMQYETVEMLLSETPNTNGLGRIKIGMEVKNRNGLV